MVLAAVFLAFFPSLLAKFAKTEVFKQKILAEIQHRFGCEASFSEIELVFVPKIQLVGHHGEIIIPGMLSGSTRKAVVVPSLLPLLKGEIQISEVRFVEPKFQINTPALPLLTVPFPDPHSGASREKQVLISTVQALATRFPKLSIVLENGQFDLLRENKPALSLGEVFSSVIVNDETMSVRIQTSPNFAAKVTFELQLSQAKGTTKAHLSLDKFRCRLLDELIPGDYPKPVTESVLDLDFSFFSSAPGLFQCKVQCSTPSLTLESRGNRLDLKKVSLSATLNRNETGYVIELSELSALSPQANLGGRIIASDVEKKFSYRFEGSQIDLASVRSGFLSFAGNHPVVRDVTDIVKSGTVVNLVMESTGGCVEDLLDFDNFSLEASLAKGKIFVPRPEIEVNDVSAEVSLKRRVLVATKFEGRTDGSKGCDGSLILPLSDTGVPFRLDMEIDADLSEVPPVIERLSSNKNLLRELAILEDVTGRAKGRLILSGDIDDLDTSIHIDSFQWSAYYQRFPFPIEVQGGAFILGGSSLSVDSIKIRSEHSIIENLSGSLYWDGEPTVELTSSPRGFIELGSLFPWLKKNGFIPDQLNEVDNVSGKFLLDAMELKTALKSLHDGQVWIEGSLEDMVFRTKSFPETIQVKTGAVSLTPSTLYLQKCQTTLLDSFLTFSGSLNGYLQKLKSADLLIEGNLGPAFSSWLWNTARWPSFFKPLNTWSISNARLNWERSGYRAISGLLELNGGVQVNIDMDLNADEFSINQLLIQDTESDARLKFTRDSDAYRIGFSGRLTKGTVSKIMSEKDMPFASIEGDFSFHFYPDDFSRFSSSGKMLITGSHWPPGHAKPVKIERISITGKGEHLFVDSAHIRCGDYDLEGHGDLRLQTDSIEVDLELAAESIDWEKLYGGLPIGDTGNRLFVEGNIQSLRLYGIPIVGTVRVNAKELTYKGFRWSPCHSVISLRKDAVVVDLSDSELCSIPAPVTLELSPAMMLFRLPIDATKLDLNNTITCLWNRQDLIRGPFDIKGEVFARLDTGSFAQELRGNLTVTSSNGRVYRSHFLVKLFSLLNISEVYRGQMPDLFTEGCGYRLLKAKLTFEDGKLKVTDGIFDGHCAKMVGHGEIDLENHMVDFTVLVSPLRTVDTIISHVPLVGKALSGSIITIPVEVKGDISDPDIIPMAPTAVASELLSFMKKIFKLPFQMGRP